MTLGSRALTDGNTPRGGQTVAARITTLILWSFAACTYRLDEGAIGRRVEVSRPSWESYQEDIKAQVGTTPVAEWEGQPEEVRVTSGTVVVVFRITGPWADMRLAMPILLRNPLMTVHRPARTEVKSGRATYTFEFSNGGSDIAVPWVELKYPREDRRIVLSKEGLWREKASPSR